MFLYWFTFGLVYNEAQSGPSETQLTAYFIQGSSFNKGIRLIAFVLKLAVVN